MGEPHEIFREAIPESERASREDLIETANYSFTGLARNDRGYCPFTDDCIRYEHGIVVTRNFDCETQFEDGSLNNVVSRFATGAARVAGRVTRRLANRVPISPHSSRLLWGLFFCAATPAWWYLLPVDLEVPRTRY